MKRAAFALLLLAVPAVAFAKPDMARNFGTKGNRLHREHVKELPEDGDRWYLTLFYRDRQRDPASIALAEMFNTNKRLYSLMQQVHLTKYESDDRMYQARFSHVGGAGGEYLPAVLLQLPRGRVVYKASASNLPASAGELADELADAIEQCRPHPPRPYRPNPDQPNRPRGPGVAPDIRPNQDSPQQDQTLLIVGAVALAGAGLYLLSRKD